VRTAEATIPDAGAMTVAEGDALAWALVLLWSAAEPHRVGEVAFVPAGGHPPRLEAGEGALRAEERLAHRRG